MVEFKKPGIQTIEEYGISFHVDPELDKIKDTLSGILSGTEAIHSVDKYTHNMSIVYMLYWYHRSKDMVAKTELAAALQEYIFGDTGGEESMEKILTDNSLREEAELYVKNTLIRRRTVDLVPVKGESSKEILTQDRGYFPKGNALPGGLILDSDEDNEIGINGDIYAALRIGGEKLLSGVDLIYGINQTDQFYFVKNNNAEIRIYFRDTNGYTQKDDLNYMTSPSDPRHLVDSKGFKCEIIGNLDTEVGSWKKKEDIMSPGNIEGNFVFNHHRDMVAHIGARNAKLDLEYANHHQWIRNIISNPGEEYSKINNSFLEQGNHINVSFPELAPVVKKILDDMFSESVNNQCEIDTTLRGIRDKAVISLRHCMLGNRVFCPYLPTLEAIFKGISFFDIIARQKKDFYSQIPHDKIYEHDPASLDNASYHMYRYEYRWNEIKARLPEQIVIPTYESLGATDLMKIRGVPVQFIGLSNDFLYVDEFEQSPQEFFMHDANHSFRMIEETDKYKKNRDVSDEDFILESNTFIKQYLDSIRIYPSDTKEAKEIKKIKKIILFEVVHEDARVFTKDSILEAILVREGGEEPFEVPHINNEGLMEIVDTLDHGISPLSYVRNKLQHGFYDKIDDHLTQIVDPVYRKSNWIAKAAFEMFQELGGGDIEADEKINYQWFLARTCSVGPDNIHETNIDDPEFKRHHDGQNAVNPKRYQA